VLFEGESELVQSLDWRERCPEMAALNSVVETKGSGREAKVYLAHRPDGACVFLGPDNRCLIHKHFGADAKPLACLMYPYALMPTGDRLAIDVAFACPGVREAASEAGEAAGDPGKVGSEPLREDDPELLAFYKKFPYKEDTRHHFLRPQVSISGELLWDIEQNLQNFLGDRALPFLVRIRCVLQYLALGLTGDPKSPTAAEFRDAIAKGMVKQVLFRMSLDGTMDRTQQAFFYQWLYLALNPIQRSFYDLSPAEQEKEQQRLIDIGNQFRDRKAHPIMGNQEMEIGFSDVQRVDASLFNSADCLLPELFFRAGILGKRYLFMGGIEQPLVEAVPRYLFYYPMMIWTAKALAAERGAEAVQMDDVREAVHRIGNAVQRFYWLRLPPKLASACRFLFVETDMVNAAINDMMALQ